MARHKRLIIAKAPYRISLFGGATDLPEAFTILNEGGAVVSFTTDLGVTAILTPRYYDKKIRVGWSGNPEEVDYLEELGHDLVREAIKLVDPDLSYGIEINFTGQIPAQSGLGSSAAVTVATLLALYELVGKDVTQEGIARKAYKIEREILGKHCGKQDQYASSYGGANYIRFLPEGEVLINPLPLSEEAFEEIEGSLILYYTGINRVKSAEKSLKTQGMNAKRNLEYLEGLRSLAKEGYEKLVKGDLSSIGELLDKGWKLKRELGDVTNNVVDELYAIAKEEGATGAKLSGAGLGGAFLVYVEGDSREGFNDRFSRRAREKLGIDIMQIPYKIEREVRGGRVIYSE
ncbi:hypothetical protein A3K63_00590 [Candidatus Micrarchaeota archaeon RBG_16_49_10]|nr:MAG: hypothetical protein A3K63_00590 [Candidatus Micrarchaeota archaeon RBG_16_49_10]